VFYTVVILLNVVTAVSSSKGICIGLNYGVVWVFCVCNISGNHLL